MIVIIESPYAGDRARNDLYLKRAFLDSIRRGETPFASHALYTQFLDDNKPEERALGIELGYRFWRYASFLAFYIDYGMSRGMEQAYDRALHRGMATITRKIGTNDAPNTD